MTVTHGGMVTFNYSGQVLIVSPIGGATDIWLLPKGHIEPGEESWETAEREVDEEASIEAIADTSSPLGTTVFQTDKGELVTTEWWAGLGRHYIPHEVGWSEADFRDTRWVSWQEALEKLSFQDQRNILRTALCLPPELTEQQIIEELERGITN